MNYCDGCNYYYYEYSKTFGGTIFSTKSECLAGICPLVVTRSVHKPAFCVGHTEKEKEMSKDFWLDSKNTFWCKFCMYYVNFRCRRHAPDNKGFPAVMPNDFCGDHRMSKTTMEKFVKENEDENE